MLTACRYFGHTRDYWWDHLTWALYEEIMRQLEERPPADRLIEIYFTANKWWQPPVFASSSGNPSGEAEIWECPLPDVTE